jgi:glycosyltransferase involved in cell wall biosynthesis
MTASHIALVLHDFSTGGSERIAIRLANAWAKKGRRVTLLCGTEQGAVRSLVSPDIAVQACAPETVRSPWSRLQLGWRLATLVRRHRPDVVFSPGNFHLVVLAVLARQQFAKRPEFFSKLSNPLRRAGLGSRLETLADGVIRRAAKPVSALIAMSPALGREARAVFGNKHIAEINEPILDDHVVLATNRAAMRRAPLILCVGRLCQQKNFEAALRAFALLPAPTDARLLILGEGPLRSSLHRMATQLGIAERVEMPGYVPDAAPFFAAADLLLMTSRYEGYPAVLIEAMAAGLPIVTTNCSLAIREILESREFGHVVDSWQPNDIARAIEAQLKRPRPSAEAIESKTAKHRIGVSAQAYLDLFDRVVA